MSNIVDAKNLGSQPSDATDPTTADRKAERDQIIKKLSRLEEKTTPGASDLSPKQALFDATDVQKRHPDKRVRWVSLKNPDKVLARKLEGYELMSEADGGRRLGEDSALAAISREKYEARVKRQEALAKARLSQHKTEMAALAEGLAKQLRDRHGIDIDVDRLLVSERE